MNADCPCIRMLAWEIRCRSRLTLFRKLKLMLAEELTSDWEHGVRYHRRLARFEGDDTVRRLPETAKPGVAASGRRKRPATWNTPPRLRGLVRRLGSGLEP